MHHPAMAARMTPKPEASSLTHALHIEDLLGRMVLARNGRPVGRLEDLRVEPDGADWIVTAYAIGVSGLLERLGLVARLTVGVGHTRGYLARPEQLDISDHTKPRLTCELGELERT